MTANLAVQPVDANAKLIRVLKPRNGSSQAIQSDFATTAVGALSVIRVVADTQGFLAIKSSGSATSSDIYIPADQPELFKVDADDTVVYFTAGGAGTAHVNIMG